MRNTTDFALRDFVKEDYVSIAQNGNNFEVARYMRDVFPHPYSEDDAKRFLDFVLNDTTRKVFAITINDEAIGAIGIHPESDVFRKNAEIGYWIGESFWHKGILSQAVPQVVQYAFQHFDITRLFGRVYSNNIASQKLLEKSDFVLEARLEKTVFKNGEFLDELIYGYRK
jgi:[ribosomal protein S5]-alanine N-acetyltransferase